MIVRITDLDDRNINVEVEDDIDTNYVINKATCQVFAKGTSIVISFWNPRDRNLSATQLVYDESIVEGLIRDKFASKAWTKPATQSDGSQATALPADQFKSFNEFLTFALFISVIKSKYSIKLSLLAFKL